MFTADIKKIALASVGALILTFASVGAAVGPARVVETTPVAYNVAPAADQMHV